MKRRTRTGGPIVDTRASDARLYVRESSRAVDRRGGTPAFGPVPHERANGRPWRTSTGVYGRDLVGAA